MTNSWLVFAAATIVSYFPIYALASRAARPGGVRIGPHGAKREFMELLRVEALKRTEAALVDVDAEIEAMLRNDTRVDAQISRETQARLREVAQLLGELFAGRTRTLCARNLELIAGARAEAHRDVALKSAEILTVLRASLRGVSNQKESAAVAPGKQDRVFRQGHPHQAMSG